MSSSFTAGGRLFCSYCGKEMLNCKCNCEKAKKDIEIQNDIFISQENLRILISERLSEKDIRKIQIEEDIKALNNELKSL
jgi:hypothetical protein